MKKFYSLIITVLLGTSLINAQPADSVKNGGFESDVIGASTATGWFLPTDHPVNQVATIDGDEHHTGKNSLKVEIAGRDTMTGVETWTLQVVNENIAVERNTPYRISIWAKGETEEESFSLTAGNSSYAEIGRLSDIKPTYDWTRYSFVASTGDNELIRIPIHILSNGTYYFDDLSVVKSPLKSAVTNTEGTKITLAFEWGINFGATIPANAFSVKVNDKANNIESVVANGTSSIDITVKDQILAEDSVTVSYDDATGGLTFASGFTGAVSAFTDEIVQNLSNGTNSISKIENSFNVYPNPVENEINVKGVNSTFNYSISNYVGQLIMSGTSTSSINAANLKSGLYFMKISTADGNTSSVKFFKK